MRIYNLLHGLADRHEVTLLSFIEQPVIALNLTDLHSLCREIQTVPWKSFEPTSGQAILGFLSSTPRSFIDTFSDEMMERIRQTIAKQKYDVVIVSELAMIPYIQAFHGAAALLEDVELGVLYEQFAHAPSAIARFRYGLTWVKHRHYLRQKLCCFRACTVVSEREKQMLAGIAPHPVDIRVIPNCIRCADYQVQVEPQPNTLIFTGPFHYHANYDAMQWFLREVYPRVQAQMPEVRLTITGEHANLPLPPASNLTLTGFVDDVRPLVAQAWISVAPLRIGGGTRIKILEAMALGTPVVATAKGAEGLDVQPGEQLLLADTPEAFAQAIIRLCKEPGLRQQLANQARRMISAQYDWTATMPRFLDLVEQVGSAKR
ncbi:MAG: glycosyltransferase [Caldilineaceae bacterium]